MTYCSWRTLYVECFIISIICPLIVLLYNVESTTAEWTRKVNGLRACPRDFQFQIRHKSRLCSRVWSYLLNLCHLKMKPINVLLTQRKLISFACKRAASNTFHRCSQWPVHACWMQPVCNTPCIKRFWSAYISLWNCRPWRKCTLILGWCFASLYGVYAGGLSGGQSVDVSALPLRRWIRRCVRRTVSDSASDTADVFTRSRDVELEVNNERNGAKHVIICRCSSCVPHVVKVVDHSKKERPKHRISCRKNAEKTDSFWT